SIPSACAMVPTCRAVSVSFCRMIAAARRAATRTAASELLFCGRLSVVFMVDRFLSRVLVPALVGSCSSFGGGFLMCGDVVHGGVAGRVDPLDAVGVVGPVGDRPGAGRVDRDVGGEFDGW